MASETIFLLEIMDEYPPLFYQTIQNFLLSEFMTGMQIAEERSCSLAWMAESKIQMKNRIFGFGDSFFFSVFVSY